MHHLKVVVEKYSSVKKVYVVVIVCVCHVRLHSACRLNVIEELEPEMRGLFTLEASSARMGVPAETFESTEQDQKCIMLSVKTVWKTPLYSTGTMLKVDQSCMLRVYGTVRFELEVGAWRSAMWISWLSQPVSGNSTQSSGQEKQPVRNSSTIASRKTRAPWSQEGAGDRSAMCSGRKRKMVLNVNRNHTAY